jgi:hypothetical protein
VFGSASAILCPTFAQLHLRSHGIPPIRILHSNPSKALKWQRGWGAVRGVGCRIHKPLRGVTLSPAYLSYCIIGGVCCQSSVRPAEWCNAGVSTIPAVAYTMSTHRARLVENGLNHLGSRLIDVPLIRRLISYLLIPTSRSRCAEECTSTNKQDKCNILKAANGISRS